MATKQEKLEEIQHEIISRGYTAVFFTRKQPVVNDFRITSIYMKHGHLYGTLFKSSYYKTTDFISLHGNRLKAVLDEIKSNQIAGYMVSETCEQTQNYTSTFKDGRVVNGWITGFVQTDDDKIHITQKENGFNICCRCRVIVFDEDEKMELNGKIVCKECMSYTNIVDCPICKTKHFNWELYRVDLTDAIRNKWKIDSSIKYIKICDDCRDRDLIQCNCCGKYELREAYSECDCRNHRILSYSYKPKKPKLLSIKGTKKNTLFLGFENECECKCDHDYHECDNCSYCRGDDECDECDYYNSDNPDMSMYPEMLVEKLGKNVYCKEDGSLDNGFEIVTEPMTYGYILANKDKFKEAFKSLTSDGVYSFSSENTGFHIHLSRAAFKSKKHLFNFAKVIYEDEKFSSAIAQRSGNGYCYYPSNSDKENGMDEFIMKTIECCDRYRAVNFSNTNTIEIRIYKGNLSFDSCLTYIQHAVSVFHYTALATKLNKGVSVIDYINYVNKRGKLYKELKNKIAKIIKGGKK